MWCAALVLLDVVGSGCGALHCWVRPHSARTLQRNQQIRPVGIELFHADEQTDRET